MQNQNTGKLPVLAGVWCAIKAVGSIIACSVRAAVGMGGDTSDAFRRRMDDAHANDEHSKATMIGMSTPVAVITVAAVGILLGAVVGVVCIVEHFKEFAEPYRIKSEKQMTTQDTEIINQVVKEQAQARISQLATKQKQQQRLSTKSVKTQKQRQRLSAKPVKKQKQQQIQTKNTTRTKAQVQAHRMQNRLVTKQKTRTSVRNAVREATKQSKQALRSR